MTCPSKQETITLHCVHNFKNGANMNSERIVSFHNIYIQFYFHLLNHSSGFTLYIIKPLHKIIPLKTQKINYMLLSNLSFSFLQLALLLPSTKVSLILYNINDKVNDCYVFTNRISIHFRFNNTMKISKQNN